MDLVGCQSVSDRLKPHNLLSTINYMGEEERLSLLGDEDSNPNIWNEAMIARGERGPKTVDSTAQSRLSETKWRTAVVVRHKQKEG